MTPSGFDPVHNPLFNVLEPYEQHAPFVLNSPHSGRFYPNSFLKMSRLSHLGIRKSEDFLVDQLISQGTQEMVPILSANFPRAYLDVNREPYELDQSLFKEPLPDYANKRSLRVTGGLGTIARIVAEGEEIYGQKLDIEEALLRIETIYKPYHETLRGLMARTHLKFGHAILIDCHSMPSMRNAAFSESRPDFVLGDRFSTSCDPQITHFAKAALQEQGYHVEINKPYAGGFITEHYGKPKAGFHALQIEINRSLYMNETRIKPSGNFENLRQDLTDFLIRLINARFPGIDENQTIAAE